MKQIFKHRNKIPSFLLSLLIISVLSLPFFAFLFKAKHLQFPEYSKIVSCLSFTFLQAALSLAFSWMLALPASLGLIAFYKKKNILF